MQRRTFLLGLAAAGMSRGAVARTPQILLRSSWQTVNIGDIAHTPGLLKLLEQHWPEAVVTLWPGKLDNGVRDILTTRFPKLRFAETAASQARAVQECDLFLHGSGPSLVGEKALAQWLPTKKPAAVFGITLATPPEATRTLLSQTKLLYLRDSVSRQAMIDAAIQGPVIDLLPDAAFAVDLRDEAKADAFRKQHDLRQGEYLCFIPKFRNTPYWLIHSKAMTEADKAKDRRNQAMKESDFDKVRPALMEVLKETPYKVLLCPEDQSHMAINREMIDDRLPENLRARVVWRESYPLTGEAVSLYAASRGLLSIDMHSPIMAVGQCIPAIHCRFAEQTSKGMMWSDFGMSDWLFDLDQEKDARRITAATMKMVTDFPAAQKQARAAAERVAKLHAAAIAKIRKLI